MDAAAVVAKEREPMNETSPTPIRTADDLATPAVARLRELVGQIEKAERLAADARAEAGRWNATQAGGVP